MSISGSSVLKLLGMSDAQAQRYRFKAVVLKEKKLAPDIEGWPVFEGEDGRIIIEFQGYPDEFIRYRLIAETLLSCAQEQYSGQVRVAIIYTDEKYQAVALPLPEFKGLKTCRWSRRCWRELVLTNHTQKQLGEIDDRLILLAPFTLTTRASKATVLAKSQEWKEQIRKVFPANEQQEALDVLGLFVLHRFSKLTYEEVRAMLGFDLMKTVAGQQVYEKGSVDDAREMVLAALEARFEQVASKIVDQVNTIGQREVLRQLLKEAVLCSSMANFRTVLTRKLTELAGQKKKSVSKATRVKSSRRSK
jgi:predicted transposase YdaD